MTRATYGPERSAPYAPFAPASLVDLLQRRAARQADRLAYTFLADGEAEEHRLTYSALDRRARAVGAALQRLGAAGERALLLYPPGLDYIAAFFGCLYAGVVAVPAYPPRRNRHTERLLAVIADAEASVIMTTAAIQDQVQQSFAEVPALRRLRWLASDRVDAAPDGWEAQPATPESLAFLQYTSGSTAAPKGVMLTHGNLLHNLHAISASFGLTEEDRGLIWLPPYHDMGLIGGILAPLYRGFDTVLMSPVHFLQRPARWLQAITRYRATASGGPDFAYKLCVNKIRPEQRAGLDLSGWRLAFNGAEPIRADTLDQFADAFGACGFRRTAFFPCYGLAEGTLIVSGGALEEAPVVGRFSARALECRQAVPAGDPHEEAHTLVGCGRSLPDQQIVIADPETHTACRPGQVGEIWVAGPSVAQGYRNRPDATRETFHARLADAGPFLRTGDLGFLQGGELFVTGRRKDLIIIRGRNLYPQDIEWTVEQSHADLRPGGCAAFALESDGEERLAVVAEVERTACLHLDVEAVVQAVRHAVAQEHLVRVSTLVLISPGSLPKTSSGKIQRHACRKELYAGALNVLGQWAQPATSLAA